MPILDLINDFFSHIAPIGDILWVFPKNFSWYASIPIIGELPLAIILLLGAGMYFTVRTGGVQFRFFARGIKTLAKKNRAKSGSVSWPLSCSAQPCVSDPATLSALPGR